MFFFWSDQLKNGGGGGFKFVCVLKSKERGEDSYIGFADFLRKKS